MVTTLLTASPRRSPTLSKVAGLLLAITLSTPLYAGATLDARSAGPELESLFWKCDYAATTHGVDMTEGQACVEITDMLRDQRFGGDFNAMLEWWKQNKQAEHTQLALRERAGL